MKSILIVLALFGVVYGVPEWTNLRTTWSLNPFNSWGFDSLPRDLSGKMENFEFRDDQCLTGGKFLGRRYWYKEDPAVSLLFDTQGIIAGIQTSMAKSVYTPPEYMQNRYYVDDGDYWTLTAYFVDPATICTTGRSQDQLKTDGTGTGFYLQQGVDPIKDSVSIPLNEDDVRSTTKWTFGHCFKTMGNHYWYNVTKDMPGDHYVPACLLYNKGKLTAFCFAVNAALTSPRYEHPTASVLPKFIDPVPDFFSTDPAYKSLSTMHVYFSSHPRIDTFC